MIDALKIMQLMNQRMLAVFAAMVVVIVLQPSEGLAQVLINGGFEDGGLSGWTPFGFGMDLAAAETNDHSPSEGQFMAIKASHNYASDGGLYQVVSWSQPVAVASAWVNTWARPGLATRETKVRIGIDPGGNAISSSDTHIIWSGYINSTWGVNSYVPIRVMVTGLTSTQIGVWLQNEHVAPPDYCCLPEEFDNITSWDDVQLTDTLPTTNSALINGGFESGSLDGWDTWGWIDSPAALFDPMMDEVPSAPISDDFSQVNFGAGARSKSGGLFQRITLLPGSTVRLTAKLTTDNSWVGESVERTPDPRTNVRIGVDPYGGVSHTAPGIMWSAFRNAILGNDFGAPVQIAASTQAQANTITVFVEHAQPNDANRATSCIDDVALQISTPLATFTPTPGLPFTPNPTILHTPTITPTAGPENTDTPTESPTHAFTPTRTPTRTRTGSPAGTETPTPTLAIDTVQLWVDLDRNTDGIQDLLQVNPGGFIEGQVVGQSIDPRTVGLYAFQVVNTFSPAKNASDEDNFLSSGTQAFEGELVGGFPLAVKGLSTDPVLLGYSEFVLNPTGQGLNHPTPIVIYQFDIALNESAVSEIINVSYDVGGANGFTSFDYENGGAGPMVEMDSPAIQRFGALITTQGAFTYTPTPTITETDTPSQTPTQNALTPGFTPLSSPSATPITSPLPNTTQVWIDMDRSMPGIQDYVEVGNNWYLRGQVLVRSTDIRSQYLMTFQMNLSLSPGQNDSQGNVIMGDQATGKTRLSGSGYFLTGGEQTSLNLNSDPQMFSYTRAPVIDNEGFYSSTLVPLFNFNLRMGPNPSENMTIEVGKSNPDVDLFVSQSQKLVPWSDPSVQTFNAQIHVVQGKLTPTPTTTPTPTVRADFNLDTAVDYHDALMLINVLKRR